MTPHDTVDDLIARTTLEGSAYDRLLLRRVGWFALPTPRKIAVQSVLLLSPASILPVVTGYPTHARAMFPASDPLTASPRVLLLTLFAVGVHVVAAAVLGAVGYYRLRLGRVTERQAARLLAAEDAAVLVGVGGGGVASIASVAVFLLCYGDPSALAGSGWITATEPFTPSGLGLSVASVGGAALAAAAAVYATSRWLRKRLDSRARGGGRSRHR